METEQSINNKTQAQALSELDQSIAQGDLGGQLETFLLCCKVDGLSPFSIKNYREKLNRFVKFCYATLQKTKPQEINSSHIRLFLLARQETCKAVAIHNTYRCLRRFFNWMVEEKILAVSPMATLHPPRLPMSIIKPFKPQHILDLLELCDNSFLGTRNRAIILIFLDTGLRLSELANIQQADIDFDREIIEVIGKGAKQRIVRMGRRTQKALLIYGNAKRMKGFNSSHLWVSQTGSPLTFWGIELMIRRLGKLAGVTDVRCSPHTFRHTSATQALRNGAGEFQVQSILGHSTLTMTRRYVATLNSEDAVEAHKRFSPVDNLKL